MIGEAPSHRGGRLTGIPFLSETLLLSENEGGSIFGRSRGYCRAKSEGGLPSASKLSTEASATIVRSTIGSIRPLPLLWNAFPFHPFESGNPFSNRTPTSAELKSGEPFLTQLLKIFQPSLILAVGNQAAKSLTALGLEHTKVRHPAQGGKPMFVQGVLEMLKNGE